MFSVQPLSATARQSRPLIDSYVTGRAPLSATSPALFPGR